MRLLYSQPGYAMAPSPVASAPSAAAHMEVPAQVPVWNQVVTWLLFWPLLTLIARQAVYFAGPALSGVLTKNGDIVQSGRDYHTALYVILIFQLAFAAAGNRKIWLLLKEHPLIPAGLALPTLSALWSATPIPTLQMAIELTLCTLFVCFLWTRFSTEQLMSLLMLMGVVASALSIFFVIALPSYGIFAGYAGGAWQGICDHKNTLGLSMAYLLTPVFFAQQYSRLRRQLYAGLLLFMIVMSQSKGAWLYTLAMLAFVGCLQLMKRFRRHESLLFTLLIVATVIAVGIIAVSSFGQIATILGKDPTMSGRTDIYREVWHSVLKAPLLGYGYGGFWKVDPEATRIGLAIGWTNIGYSESGVLDLALHLGFAGVALVLLMLGRAVVQGVRLLRSPSYSPRVGWFLTILFLAAVTNVDAGWLLVSGTLDWVMILIACIGLEAETRRARTAGEHHFPSYAQPLSVMRSSSALAPSYVDLREC
jgi:exopolysaccharide production protein ExoQ